MGEAQTPQIQCINIMVWPTFQWKMTESFVVGLPPPFSPPIKYIKEANGQ